VPTQVDASTNTRMSTTVVEKQNLRMEENASTTPPSTSEEGSEDERADEVEEEREEEEEEEHSLAVDMERSRSGSSWGESITVSSPSTSIATHIQRDNTTEGQEQHGSPYVDSPFALEPIRDTPRNPFLQGGPADVGYTGPNKNFKGRARNYPPRERGRMTYVL